MRQKYDFSSGIRGKYLPRLAKGANVVVLDRDMAKVFPSSKAVNDALRVLAEAGRRHGKAKGSTRVFSNLLISICVYVGSNPTLSAT